MTKGDIEEAVKSGHKASRVLTDVLRSLAVDHYCPQSYGFEGPETFSDCGICAHCIAKKMHAEKII